MRIDVVTLFPPMIHSWAEYGVIGRAAKRGLLSLTTWNPRDYAHNKHRHVDDRPYGGGPGMVMEVQPLADAVTAARQSDTSQRTVIYLSPQGRRLDQSGVTELAQRPGLILVAGRYEGVDERFIESHVDEEWSIGDYVLSGGELGAMVVIDAVARLLPGVLGHDESAVQDSFVNGLLDCPHYTRPEDYQGRWVPDVLLSGDHAHVARWRMQQALGRTWERRPELLANVVLSREQQALLDDYIAQKRKLSFD